MEVNLHVEIFLTHILASARVLISWVFILEDIKGITLEACVLTMPEPDVAVQADQAIKDTGTLRKFLNYQKR